MIQDVSRDVLSRTSQRDASGSAASQRPVGLGRLLGTLIADRAAVTRDCKCRVTTAEVHRSRAPTLPLRSSWAQVIDEALVVIFALAFQLWRVAHK